MPVHAAQASLYASAARTETPAAAEFDSEGRRGLHLTIDVTAAADTPSVVPTVDGYDSLSGKWVNLITGAAITGTGTTRLTVYPGVTPAANVAVSTVVPGRLRLVMTHADSDSITYSAAAALVA